MVVTIVYILTVTRRAWANSSAGPLGILRGAHGRRGVCVALAVVCSVAAAGCGRSAAATRKDREAIAARVCKSATQAARPLLGNAVRLHVADADPTNIECQIESTGIRVDAVAQASAVAWTEFGTATVHQSQVYGSGALNEPGQLPHAVPGMGGNVAWIPAERELLATNGTESRGGTYLTVTVTRASARGPTSLALARAVGRSMLSSAPRGPNPGTPPS